MNIAKIISSIVIIIASTMIGIGKARKLSDREYILREFVSFLNSIKNEIKYMLTVLPNAYEQARMPLKTKLKSALGAIALDMINDDFKGSINSSISKNINEIEELASYDKILMITTLKNLGTTNVEGQINIIENAIKTLENQINEAVCIKNKNSRLYRTIGALCGIMIVVVFV